MYCSLRSEYYENELEVCPYMEQLKPRVPANISPVSSQQYLVEGELMLLTIKKQMFSNTWSNQMTTSMWWSDAHHSEERWFFCVAK